MPDLSSWFSPTLSPRLQLLTYRKNALLFFSCWQSALSTFMYDSLLIISLSLAQKLFEKFFQLARILSKLTNTLRQLVRSHLILIQHPTECLLIHSDLLNISLTCCKQNYCLRNVNSSLNHTVQKIIHNCLIICMFVWPDLPLLCILFTVKQWFNL